MENKFRIYKKPNKTYTQHEPKGRQAYYQTNRGPDERKSSSNPHKNTSTPRVPPLNQLKRPKGARPPKKSTFGLDGSSAVPGEQLRHFKLLLGPAFSSRSMPTDQRQWRGVLVQLMQWRAVWMMVWGH
jgi:hypothetical protein